MTINRSNYFAPEPKNQTPSQDQPLISNPVIDLSPVEKTDTSGKTEARDEVFLARETFETKTDIGWLEAKVLQQARRLNSDGDQVSIEFKAKATVKYLGGQREISGTLGRSGTPSKYTFSLDSSQLVGVAIPPGSPLQAFAGIGSGAKLEFSFSTPEQLAKSITDISSGRLFEADVIAVEYKISAQASASFEFGVEMGKDLTLNLAQLGVKGEHHQAIRYESRADGGNRMVLVTTSELEASGSVGPSLAGKSASKKDLSFKAISLDGTRTYLLEHKQTIELPKQKGLFNQLTQNPFGKYEGTKLPDTVKFQEQTKQGLSMSSSSLSLTQAETSRAQGKVFELSVDPGKYSMVDTIKTAIKGEAELRDHLASLGETKEENYDLSVRCRGLGRSHGMPGLSVTVSLQACHQDRMKQGQTAFYMDKACVLSPSERQNYFSEAQKS
jgi:hypothetical protein